uniref:Uncharacterized protein n=1 Tax=Candidatus Kentrum sp. FM TaxID=2126340 RepID=A0A450WDH7_9GAMM|nr:MAG: hypothetical protein BECKFM1743C_GA0114222_103565 [Candidatus Kentron sp. FM]VFJ64355.1 MAG: hypothetical protein BECKFM1743A_GA0114220_103546 [Candidatus Kentron sp. FM]VFK15129.1 MAG: hypothetical protein BECKFM1743B_GA0114221_103565 [Candidatus Kentron sp. FM]
MNENTFHITNLTLGDIGALIAVAGVLMAIISASVTIWYGRKALANPLRVTPETGGENPGAEQSAERICNAMAKTLAHQAREHAEELAARDTQYGERLACQERELAELAKTVETLRGDRTTRHPPETSRWMKTPSTSPT